MKVVLTNDGSWTLYSPDVQETFHSCAGAYSESRKVFLENSGAADRLEQGLATRILEIGFGTGLNFFLTADEALRRNTSLDYTCFDPWLIGRETLETLNYRPLLDHPELVDWFFVPWRDGEKRNREKRGKS